MSDLLVLKDIKKIFGVGESAVHALRGIDLTIKKGDFTAILGRSGSGKSTLLQIIGLLDRPTSGLVSWDGSSVTSLNDDDLSELRGKRIGFVFQQFHLLTSFSLLDNVALPLVYQGIPHDERIKLAKEALAIVHMDHRMSHKPHELSGGERQRGAIARAIVHKPQLILADEPTGNLDSHVRDEIMQYLAQMNADLHATLLVVTHDEATAAWARNKVTLVDGLIKDQVQSKGKP